MSLSVLPESFSQVDAAAILNLSRPSATKKLQLRREPPSSIKVPNQGLFKYTALLIQSFAREKGEQEMKETVLTSAQSPRLCVLHFHIREAKRAVSYRTSHD